LAQGQGIRPLAPGEKRPAGYYLVNHDSGDSPVRAGATSEKDR
jgi:hypothetical protein